MVMTNPPAIDDERAQQDISDPIVLTDAGFNHIDAGRVRHYCRLAAVVPAALILLSAILIDWALHAIFDVRLGSIWVVTLTIALVLFGLKYYIQRELKLRSYHLLISAHGIIFEYGRTRTRIKFEHVQLMDRETSMLLKKFQLIRLNLHTAGGMISLSPVPVDVSRTVEQLLYGQQQNTKAVV